MATLKSRLFIGDTPIEEATKEELIGAIEGMKSDLEFATKNNQQLQMILRQMQLKSSQKAEGDDGEA
jgi:hypothetical protein